MVPSDAAATLVKCGRRNPRLKGLRADVHWQFVGPQISAFTIENESAIADLPADLRWLYESGAVTIEELAAIHARLGSTSARDLLTDVRRHAIRDLPGFSPELEAAVAAAAMSETRILRNSISFGGLRHDRVDGGAVSVRREVV